METTLEHALITFDDAHAKPNFKRAFLDYNSHKKYKPSNRWHIKADWQNIHKFTDSKLIELYTGFVDLATRNMSTKNASVAVHTQIMLDRRSPFENKLRGRLPKIIGWQ